MRWLGSGQIHNASMQRGVMPVYTGLDMFTRDGQGVKAAINEMHLASDTR